MIDFCGSPYPACGNLAHPFCLRPVSYTHLFILMNFISAVLMILSLRKYFQWNTFSVKNALKEIRKEGQLSVLTITALVLILFISLVFGIYFSIR